MRFCASCGSPVAADKPFCTTCGVQLAPLDAQTVTGQAVRSATQTETAPAMQSATSAAGRSRRYHRISGWMLAVLITVVAALCGTVIALAAAGPAPIGHTTLGGRKTPAPAASSALSHGTTPPAAPSVTPTPVSSSVTQATEQTGAQDLAQLLAHSVTDRSAIVAAVGDVNACANPAGDAQTFQQSATSRKQLLTQLRALPDSSALPTQMLQDLAAAWQASYQADEDFTAWAEYENSNGCTPNDSSDPNLEAASAPDDQATTDKQAFVSLWDPIAVTYGLTTYQWKEL
jgi:hypothetical protein